MDQWFSKIQSNRIFKNDIRRTGFSLKTNQKHWHCPQVEWLVSSAQCGLWLVQRISVKLIKYRCNTHMIQIVDKNDVVFCQSIRIPPEGARGTGNDLVRSCQERHQHLGENRKRHQRWGMGTAASVPTIFDFGTYMKNGNDVWAEPAPLPSDSDLDKTPAPTPATTPHQ